MKEYLLLFWNASGDGQYDLDPATMKETMAAWQGWIGQIALQGNLVSTKPINWDGATVSNSAIADHPVIKQGEMVTGYLICKAKNLDEVKGWARTCPILHHKAGFTEIREIAPFEI